MGKTTPKVSNGTLIVNKVSKPKKCLDLGSYIGSY
jgi:hypothetical protein